MKAHFPQIVLFLGFAMGVQSATYSQTMTCKVSDFNTCSSEDLLNAMSDTLDNSDSPDVDLVQKIEGELIKRKAVDSTYKFFSKIEHLTDLHWTSMILTALRSKHVDDLLRRDATGDLTLRAYFANSYFAETGQEFALANLNKNYYQYEIPSFAWADTVTLFGKYKYYPAKANLVSTINAAEVNLGDASLESLEMLYPETKPQVDTLKTLEEITAFYSAYIKMH